MIRIMATLMAACFSSLSYAADGRWFEIEVLVFSQPDALISETLANDNAKLDDYHSNDDIITEGYITTLTKQCLAGQIDPPTTPAKPLLASDNQVSAACEYSKEDFSALTRLPQVVDGEVYEHTDTPYVLAQSQLQFSDKRDQLARIGRQVLLHTGWRFPGQSKRTAPKFRLYGGELIAQVPKNVPNSADFLSPIRPEYNLIWQLDGFLKVHLNHYLYITSALTLRQTGDTETHLSGEFSQFRRVISGEIHYFDHPQLGMLVQIRRFNH